MAWFDQQPGEEEDHEELEPQRDGVCDAVEASAADGLTLRLRQQEEGADRDDAGLTLEEVDEDDRRDAAKRPESEGVCDDKVHQLVTSSAPAVSASAWRSASRSESLPTRARAAL